MHGDTRRPQIGRDDGHQPDAGRLPRRSIDAGTITITAVQTEEAGNARDINFDPLVLPDGITASDDPLPAARSAVYSRSFTLRAEEPKSPSEVNVHQVLP